VLEIPRDNNLTPRQKRSGNMAAVVKAFFSQNPKLNKLARERGYFIAGPNVLMLDFSNKIQQKTQLGLLTPGELNEHNFGQHHLIGACLDFSPKPPGVFHLLGRLRRVQVTNDRGV
jgi:hypothetical protein